MLTSTDVRNKIRLNSNASALDVAIIVNSCDAYSELWDAFFLCLADYWPSCTYPIVLNTERKSYSPKAGINFDIKTHHHYTNNGDLWGARLIATLNDTSAEYVIVLYDDFLLNAPVDQECIKRLVDLISATPSCDVIYLTKLIGVEKGATREDGLASVKPRVDYRLNSAPAIWRKSALLNFTGDKDNPWAWEYFGSYRTFGVHSVFLAVANSANDIYPYDYSKGGAIYRGKWVAEVIDPVIEKHQLLINTAERGTVAASFFPKRNLRWKVSFVAAGIQMIGPRIVFFMFRYFKTKIFNLIR